jgi:hypothetical protein
VRSDRVRHPLGLKGGPSAALPSFGVLGVASGGPERFRSEGATNRRAERHTAPGFPFLRLRPALVASLSHRAVSDPRTRRRAGRDLSRPALRPDGDRKTSPSQRSRDDGNPGSGATQRAPRSREGQVRRTSDEGRGPPQGGALGSRPGEEGRREPDGPGCDATTLRLPRCTGDGRGMTIRRTPTAVASVESEGARVHVVGPHDEVVR